MDSTLKQLIKEEEKCYSSCSDYSCVRSGCCTGYASHKLSDYHYDKQNNLKKEQEYQNFKILMNRYSKEKIDNK
jgi:hypothetical protein